MTEICLFAGTSEGRALTEFLGKQPCGLTVCVATEYGGELLACPEQVRVIRQRLSQEEILNLLEENNYDLVIDATHPYAVKVTENISEACGKTGTEYLRLLRGKSQDDADAVIVPDVGSAVDFLETVTGNILLTTGSKDIDKFSRLTDFSGRVFARVLPMISSLEACRDAGLRASQIIAMQGPFSVETNLAQLHETGARWLVTKDSGTAGGFEAKAEAARMAGAGLVVIGRPPQQNGLSETETYEFLKNRFGFLRKPLVTVAGIGPGSKEMMTESALRAIESADCLIGAERMLESVSWIERNTFAAID
ncbi:MAG: precorrin-6A reductase, partial [Anaerolineaceae bacterium]|nr:precorrin-6A reductase [Anaerolineaceae bacterium]